MATEEELLQQIEAAAAASQLAADIGTAASNIIQAVANGDDQTEVQTDNGPVPTLARWLALMTLQLESDFSTDLANKLGKAGDTITTVSEVTDSSASATLDWAAAMVFVRTITADTAFDFDNVPTVGSTKRELHLTAGGSYVVTWPASNFAWVGGEAPTLGATDRIIFSQYEGDTTVYAEARSVTA